MPHPLHEQVRWAFEFRCGYCRVGETSAGAELTVDHYCPLAAGGGDELTNLVYACFRCNLYKGDYWPSLEEEAAGLFVLHPQRHNLAGHLRENSRTGHLEPLTATGAFNIRLLHLNRPQLVAQRLERQALDVERQRLQLLQSEIEQSEQTIRVLEQYINFLLRFGAAENSTEDD
jgi:HNH endonuclease